MKKIKDLGAFKKATKHITLTGLIKDSVFYSQFKPIDQSGWEPGFYLFGVDAEDPYDGLIIYGVDEIVEMGYNKEMDPDSETLFLRTNNPDWDKEDKDDQKFFTCYLIDFIIIEIKP